MYLTMTKSDEIYRVVANYPSRDPYPVYKIYNEPKEWSCNGSVIVTCKDGRVNVTIMEKDSINKHQLEVYSDEGPVAARLTEQTSHPEGP